MVRFKRFYDPWEWFSTCVPFVACRIKYIKTVIDFMSHVGMQVGIYSGYCGCNSDLQVISVWHFTPVNGFFYQIPKGKIPAALYQELLVAIELGHLSQSIFLCNGHIKNYERLYKILLQKYMWIKLSELCKYENFVEKSKREKDTINNMPKLCLQKKYIFKQENDTLHGNINTIKERIYELFYV